MKFCLIRNSRARLEKRVRIGWKEKKIALRHGARYAVMFKIFLHQRARKAYERLSSKAVRLFEKAFLKLEQNPFSGGDIKLLHGELKGCCRLRVGDYRIVYSVNSEQKIIIVYAIGQRGGVY